VSNIEKHILSLNEEFKNISKELPNLVIHNEELETLVLLCEIKGVSSEDVAYHLSNENIFVRNGSACVKAKNNFFNGSKTFRISFNIYNNSEDVRKIIDALKKGGDFLDVLFSERKTPQGCK